MTSLATRYFPGIKPVLILLSVIAALAVFPWIAGVYQTMLLTYGLVIAIAALGFNLLLGYTGLLSFGHCAYFGTGVYAVALMSKYFGVAAMEAHIAVGLVATALVAALFGFISVRHSRVFFAILTMALSQVLWTLVYKFYWLTGGTDGIRVPFPTLLGGLIEFKGGNAYQDFINQYYFYVAVIFVFCIAVMWLIVHSPFGKALQAIRDNDTRAAFIGIRVRMYRWFAFIISGMFTGLGGILWVPLNRIATPEILYWPFSGEIVFLTVLGGFQSFAGPVVGAIIFNYLKTYAVASTEYWQLLLGGVLVVLVFVMPSGLVGAIERITSVFKTDRSH